MFRLLAGVVMVASVTLAAEAKAPAARAPEPGMETYACGCLQVWEAAQTVFARAGFRPDGNPAQPAAYSTWTWKRRTSGWVHAADDVKKLTTTKVGWPNGWWDFAIESAEFWMTPLPGTCTAQVALNYLGYHRGLTEGWVALESNFRFESQALAGIRSELKKVGHIR